MLDSFAAAGGMIIGLSGGTTEMDQFFSASGLLDVSAQTPVPTGSTLYKSALGQMRLGHNLISPFAAPADSCTFHDQRRTEREHVFRGSRRAHGRRKAGRGAPRDCGSALSALPLLSGSR